MVTELRLDTRLKRSSEPLQAGLDDEVVMMSVEKGKYYGLDPVGARIWGLLENPILVSELIERLVEEYEVEQQTCESETLEFLTSLLEEDLVELVE